MAGSGIFGLGPDPINHNFNYDVDQTQYRTDPRLNRSYNNLNRQGNRLNNMSVDFSRTADEFLDPNSSWLRGQRANLVETVGDNTRTSSNALNTLLAQRGVGSGGMKSLMEAVNVNRSGEQIKKGFNELVGQGVNFAQGYDQMGLNAQNAATNAYGAGAQVASGIDQRATNVSLANSAAVNQRNQYENQGRYEMAAGNAARTDSFNNAMLGLGTTLIGGAFGAGGIFGQSLGNQTHQYFGPHNVSGTATATTSDIRLKKNIEFIKKENGFNVYSFNYNWSDKKYSGVMAQEVMKTKPEAVIKSNGYYKVKYDLIGIDFKEIN